MHWIALIIVSVILYNRINKGDRGWTHFTKEDADWAEAHADQIENN